MAQVGFNENLAFAAQTRTRNSFLHNFTYVIFGAENFNGSLLSVRHF
jgi:hypothetical protein